MAVYFLPAIHAFHLPKNITRPINSPEAIKSPKRHVTLIIWYRLVQLAVQREHYEPEIPESKIRTRSAAELLMGDTSSSPTLYGIVSRRETVRVLPECIANVRSNTLVSFPSEHEPSQVLDFIHPLELSIACFHTHCQPQRHYLPSCPWLGIFNFASRPLPASIRTIVRRGRTPHTPILMLQVGAALQVVSTNKTSEQQVDHLLRPLTPIMF